jgi:hypothetical protein
MNPGKLVGTSLRGNIRIPPILFEFGMDAMATVKKVLPKDNTVDERAEVLAQQRAKKERGEAVHGHPKEGGKH